MARVAAALGDRMDVKLLIPDEDNERFCILCDTLGVNYEVVPMTGLTWQPGALAKFALRSPFEVLGLVRKIRKEKPDILTAWGGAWQVKAAVSSRLTGVPLVWLLNDTSQPEYIRRIFSFFARKTAAFVSASQKTHEYYLPLLPQEACKAVIQSMVDLDGFDPARSYPGDEELIESWNDDFVVGAIANVSPVKGLETFIRVAARANAAGRKCRFVILGETYKRQEGYRDRLLKLASELGADNIQYAGARRDVRPLLNRFDAYLCSSINESSPVAVWEAMAMARPVVSTSVGDVPLFIKDGTNGCLAPVGDDAALWAAVERLIADPVKASAMGMAARKTAQEAFGSDEIAAQMHAFYRGVLASDGAAKYEAD